MYDYMRVLYHQFVVSGEQLIDMEQRVKLIRKQLTERLKGQERAVILALADLETTLMEQACLNSFVSGYRLAYGIQQELLRERLPYGFAGEAAVEKMEPMDELMHASERGSDQTKKEHMEKGIIKR